jgi:hypothetical protein
MKLRELATMLAVLTAMETSVKEKKDTVRAALLAAFDETGSDAAAATLPDGTKIGNVTRVEKVSAPTVTDNDALTKWVRLNRPDELVVTVRESYRKHLLDNVWPGPDNQAIDSKTGEIIPGITFRKANPYVSCRFKDGGRDATMAALTDGTLSVDFEQTPQLEGN